MNHGSNRPHRTRSLIRSIALAAVLTVGAAACSTDDPPEDGTSTASGAADATEKATTALDAGLESHAAGDLTAAAAKYEETLEYDPQNQFAFYNLALLDEAAGNYGLAEEKYRAALETDPTYGPALFNLAILRTGPDPEEAIELYQAAVKSDRKDAAAWLNLGLLLRTSGEQVEGDEAVLRAIALNPELVDPAEVAPEDP